MRVAIQHVVRIGALHHCRRQGAEICTAGHRDGVADEPWRHRKDGSDQDADERLAPGTSPRKGKDDDRGKEEVYRPEHRQHTDDDPNADKRTPAGAVSRFRATTAAAANSAHVSIAAIGSVSTYTVNETRWGEIDVSSAVPSAAQGGRAWLAAKNIKATAATPAATFTLCTSRSTAATSTVGLVRRIVL